MWSRNWILKEMTRGSLVHLASPSKIHNTAPKNQEIQPKPSKFSIPIHPNPNYTINCPVNWLTISLKHEACVHPDSQKKAIGREANNRNCHHLDKWIARVDENLKRKQFGIRKQFNWFLNWILLFRLIFKDF